MPNTTAEMLMHGRTDEEVLSDALMRHGYLTGHGAHDGWSAAAIALADVFGIAVTGEPSWLDDTSVRCAERNLGLDVPEPFYRGFPQSVLELDVAERLVDQFVHYLLTYGLGNFSGPSSHSLLEEPAYRALFDEETPKRTMEVVSPERAIELAEDWARDVLDSKRPASTEDLALVSAVLASDPDFEVGNVACRETLVYVADVTDDPRVEAAFGLRDVLELAAWFAHRDNLMENGEGPWYRPASKRRSLKNLRMRNQDRKRLTRTLDGVLARGLSPREKFECYERRADWVGLLHHIHYKPLCDNGVAFVNAIRKGDNKGRMARFESMLGQGQAVMAADFLAKTKGPGALLRNLDYILSRARTDAEKDAVLDLLECNDVTQLLQLLAHYSVADDDGPRDFSFTRFGKLRVHHETPEEAESRRTVLDETCRAMICDHVRTLLRKACQGRIKETAYVDEDLRGIAVPLSVAASNAGIDTMPSGSRMPLERGIVRAFTYWEKVNDVDLSAFGLTTDGRMHEFSWRTMARRQTPALTYSGDVTNGYDGGSEYFDVDLDLIATTWPDVRYLVFCDNVYSGRPFDKCDVRAGYMLRADAMAGNVFEPKTVRTSFAITGDSTYAYLFAIDVATREVVWLNLTKDSDQAVAGAYGARSFDFLDKWLHMTDAIDLYELLDLMVENRVDNVCEACVAFVRDRALTDGEDVETVTPADSERIRSLLG